VAELVVDCIVRVAPIAWRVRVLIAFKGKKSNLCQPEKERERERERVKRNRAKADVVWRNFALRPGPGVQLRDGFTSL
jgi:hypothetical protein